MDVLAEFELCITSLKEALQAKHNLGSVQHHVLDLAKVAHAIKPCLDTMLEDRQGRRH